MAKLEGFSKVAVIKFGGNYPYHFAIYDDGTDYQVGDYVVVSANSPNAKIDEIISVEEAAKRSNKNITAEVIAKFDKTAYDKRVEQRKEKEKLKKELDKRKKEIQKKLDDEYYASKDKTYAEMLRQYESLENWKYE